MDWLWIIFVIIIFLIIIGGSSRRVRKAVGKKLVVRKKSRQLRIINHYRKKHGLRPLKAYYALDRIAKSHSSYLAKHRACNHDGFKVRSIKVQKVTGSGSVGENCFKYPAHSYNKRIAIKLVNGWMKSPGHRRNLMNPNYTKIGIGIVIKRGYVYATQVFSS